MRSSKLTQLGNLSYTARRAAGTASKGSQEKMVIYWATDDKKAQRETMDALGIGYVSVNGESDYNGDAERLEPYVEKGLMKVRIKKI